MDSCALPENWYLQYPVTCFIARETREKGEAKKYEKTREEGESPPKTREGGESPKKTREGGESPKKTREEGVGYPL